MFLVSNEDFPRLLADMGDCFSKHDAAKSLRSIFHFLDLGHGSLSIFLYTRRTVFTVKTHRARSPEKRLPMSVDDQTRNEAIASPVPPIRSTI
ncbi:hypothetical protein [Burkholderia glumae]